MCWQIGFSQNVNCRRRELIDQSNSSAHVSASTHLFVRTSRARWAVMLPQRSSTRAASPSTREASAPTVCRARGGSRMTDPTASAMIQSKFNDAQCKLQTFQKDLRLSVNMSDAVDQPLHVGSAVNELFKKAKAKGYGEHNTSAVFRAAAL